MVEWIVEYWVQALFGVMCAAVGTLGTLFLQYRKRQKALEAGVLALLRDRIIDRCQHYLEVGEVPVYGMANIESLFSAYSALQVDGAVTKLVGDVRDLPMKR